MQTKDISYELILHCSPKVAYDSWLDSEIHSKIINGNAVINPVEDGKFSIWDDYIIGKTIMLNPKKYTIIQTWRDDSTDWQEDYYSTITLTFEPHNKYETKMKFLHKGIPAEHAKSIEKGWKEYYWKPMIEYFKKTT